jgi:hypothetical protein
MKFRLGLICLGYILTNQTSAQNWKHQEGKEFWGSCGVLPNMQDLQEQNYNVVYRYDYRWDRAVAKVYPSACQSDRDRDSDRYMMQQNRKKDRKNKQKKSKKDRDSAKKEKVKDRAAAKAAKQEKAAQEKAAKIAERESTNKKKKKNKENTEEPENSENNNQVENTENQEGQFNENNSFGLLID